MAKSEGAKALEDARWWLARALKDEYRTEDERTLLELAQNYLGKRDAEGCRTLRLCAVSRLIDARCFRPPHSPDLNLNSAIEALVR